MALSTLHSCVQAKASTNRHSRMFFNYLQTIPYTNNLYLNESMLNALNTWNLCFNANILGPKNHYVIMVEARQTQQQ